MDVTSNCRGSDISEVGEKKKQSECSQPTANGNLPHHSSVSASRLLPVSLSQSFSPASKAPPTEEAVTHTETPPPLPAPAPPPPPDRSEDSSDDSLIDSSTTNDVCRLLASQPAPSHRKQKGVDSSSAAPPPPVCSPPSSSSPPSRSSTCDTHLHHHHHHHPQRTNQKRLSSTRSHASIKTDANHIKEVAGDDCCVHCLLACLFCELLSMCSALGECLVCGLGGAGCCEAAVGSCCCLEAAGEAACTEEACQAVLDCGILEGCCGSSECLEVCLECCSICFPS